MADAQLKFRLEVDDNGSVKIRRFGKTVDDVALKGSTFGEKFKAAAAGIGSLATNALKAAAAMTAVGVAMAGAVAGKALSAFADYEQALIRMSVVSDQSLGAIADKIRTLGPELGTQTELMLGYYEVLSAGVSDYADELDFLTQVAKLSKMEQVDMGEAVKGVSGIYQAYKDEIKDTTDVIEKLYKVEAKGKITTGEMMAYLGEIAGIAKSTGLSLDELASSIALVSKSAGGASQTFTQLKALLVAVSNNFDKLPESLQQFGNAANAIKQLGFEGVLAAIAKETGLSTDKLFAMLGSVEAVNAAIALAKNEGKDFASVLGQMGEETALFDEKWKQFSDTLKQVWATFKNTIGNILIEIGQELAPTIKELVKTTGDWMRAIKPTIVEGLRKALEGLPEKIRQLRDKFAEGQEYVERFFNFLKEQGPTLIRIGEAFVTLGGKIADALIKLMDFMDYAKSHATDTEVSIDFWGTGSTKKPLGEKIAEMQDKLEVFSELANSNSKATVDFVGKVGGGEKPLGQAIDEATTKVKEYTKTIEKLPLKTDPAAKSTGELSEEITKTGNAAQDAAVNAGKVSDGFAEITNTATGTRETLEEMGIVLDYTMQSARREVSETGRALSEHAANVRQVADEYELWYRQLIKVAEGIKFANIYSKAAKEAFYDYVNDVAKEERRARKTGDFNVNRDRLSNKYAPKGGVHLQEYQTGTGVQGLPRTGPIFAHKGEIIIDPMTSAHVRSVTRRSKTTGKTERHIEPKTGGGTNITVSINPGVMIGDRTGLKALMPHLKEELDIYLRRTGTGWRA